MKLFITRAGVGYVAFIFIIYLCGNVIHSKKLNGVFMPFHIISQFFTVLWADLFCGLMYKCQLSLMDSVFCSYIMLLKIFFVAVHCYFRFYFLE